MKNSGLRRDYKACSRRLHFYGYDSADVSRETLAESNSSGPKTTTATVSRETIAASEKPIMEIT
ncbi:hypothetical protein [Collimonas fungivorans]|uniref:hypothetical protein n=1 Tax=Collimonas fungivorans TaxID=158899 RepID=UPI0011D2670B